MASDRKDVARISEKLSGIRSDNRHPAKILQGCPTGWEWYKSGAFEV